MAAWSRSQNFLLTATVLRHKWRFNWEKTGPVVIDRHKHARTPTLTATAWRLLLDSDWNGENLVQSNIQWGEEKCKKTLSQKGMDNFREEDMDRKTVLKFIANKKRFLGCELSLYGLRWRGMTAFLEHNLEDLGSTLAFQRLCNKDCVHIL